MNTIPRRKILVLTPRFPYPVVGGDRLRIYQVCKALAEHNDLTLLSFCETEAEMALPIPDDGVFTNVERVLLTRAHSYWNTLKVLFTKTPMQVGYYQSRRFAERAEVLIQNHDAVLCHLIRTAEYARNASIPRFLEMTDAISMNYRRARSHATTNGIKGLVYAVESSRLLAYERQVIRDFDRSVLVSQVDADFLAEPATEHRLLVCSNGVDLNALPFSLREHSKPVLVYIGKMTTLQNLDACEHFAKTVLPVLRRSLEVTFRIVGQIGDRDAERLRQYEGVEVTGAVPSIPDAVADARAGVCPVRIGAGVQNKVLEYMALGLPAVVSQMGLEGLDAVPDEDLLVADTTEQYLKCVSDLWKDVSLRHQLARNALSYVKRNHDWPVRLGPFLEYVNEPAARSARDNRDFDH